MSRHELAIFDGAAKVGTLGYDSHEEAFAFEYDALWRERSDAYSISPHIKMTGAPPASGTVRRFLENLLPEGKALDVVAATHQVSKNNIFGLIRELGRETTGALAFFEEGKAPDQHATTRREVTRAELATRIADRAQLPFEVWDGKVRMSIAGYQDKLAVYKEGVQMYLVEGQLASTHILKPEPEGNRTPTLVANEHYCMSLAARLQLPVAAVAIERLPAAVLVVERFDRRRNAQGVQRLHIVDACQTLNFPVSYKYERNFGSGRDVRHIRDGVSFQRLFSAASDYTIQKAVTQRDLLRWMIFQYLIGNSDAHGKNVSFFCGPQGLTLAPFYDLVSVVQYERLDHEVAMAYGDEFALADIRAYDWAQFAQHISMSRGLLQREMRRMAKLATEQAPIQAADATYSSEEQGIVQRIAAFVTQQARALVAAAEPVTGVDLEWK
jgi:serine/threonine-protein kinase HipA